MPICGCRFFCAVAGSIDEGVKRLARAIDAAAAG